MNMDYSEVFCCNLILKICICCLLLQNSVFKNHALERTAAYLCNMETDCRLYFSVVTMHMFNVCSMQICKWHKHILFIIDINIDINYNKYIKKICENCDKKLRNFYKKINILINIDKKLNENLNKNVGNFDSNRFCIITYFDKSTKILLCKIISNCNKSFNNIDTIFDKSFKKSCSINIYKNSHKVTDNFFTVFIAIALLFHTFI